jgi:DNA-binding transcriptional regulator LsrR (DeoR family)
MIFATSCGSTVLEAIRALEQDPGGLKYFTIYSLLITMAAQMQEVSPAGIVALLTDAIPSSTGYAVQLPRSRDDLRSAQKAKRNYSVDCDPILDGALEAACALTGIGAIGERGITHSFNDLVRALSLKETLDRLNAVGEMCYQPINIDGDSLMEKDELSLLRSNLFYVTLEQLRQKVEERRVTVFAVAGGLEKHRAILAALRTKAFDRLVTDVESARYVLR